MKLDPKKVSKINAEGPVQRALKSAKTLLYESLFGHWPVGSEGVLEPCVVIVHFFITWLIVWKGSKTVFTLS